MTVYQRLQKLVAESNGLDTSVVTAEMPLEQFEDSFGLVELVMLVEEEFDLHISDDEAEVLTEQIREFTVGQFASLIEQRLGK